MNLPSLAALAIAAGVTACPCVAQEKAEHEARQRFERAAAQFNAGALDVASASFSEFLRDFPTSPLAPEAAFKLAAVHLVLGKSAEAAKAQEKLVRDYHQSPWAYVVLVSQYDEKRLLALANEHARRGRDGPAAATAAAVGVYQVCLRRCGEKLAALNPGTPPPAEVLNIQKEALYRLGDSLRRLGQLGPFQGIMQQVRSGDPSGAWGTLAALRLADARTFGERMDDLLNARPGDSEEMHVFLELAAQHAGRLEDAARAKCQFYQARCRFGLNQDDRGVALCEDLRAKHPESAWAAEATLRLAEHCFQSKDASRARELYADLMARHPDSRRAAQARAWRDWLDSAEPAWKDLEAILLELALTASTSNGSFALRFQREDEAGKPSISGRLAMAGTDRYLVSLSAGPAGFLLARNRDGSWLRFMDRKDVSRCKKGIDLPLPRLSVTETGVCNVAWGMGNQAPLAAGPPIQVAPGAVGYFIERGRAQWHLHKEATPAKGKSAVYRLERPCWSHPNVDVVEIEVVDGRTIREVRLVLYSDQGEKSAWTATDLTLGGPVADGAFVPELPPGVAVHEVDEISPMEVFGGVMRLIAQAGELLGTTKKASPTR